MDGRGPPRGKSCSLIDEALGDDVVEELAEEGGELLEGDHAVAILVKGADELIDLGLVSARREALHGGALESELADLASLDHAVAVNVKLLEAGHGRLEGLLAGGRDLLLLLFSKTVHCLLFPANLKL